VQNTLAHMTYWSGSAASVDEHVSDRFAVRLLENSPRRRRLACTAAYGCLAV
jgi:hypothetical protein